MEDLSQETFLRAWESLDRIEEPYRFGGWSRRIAERVFARWVERTRKDQERFEKLKDRVLRQPDGAGETSAVGEDMRVLGARILAEMSLEMRLPLEDRLRGRSFAWIAKRHGLSPSTARRRVREAIDHARTRLFKMTGQNPDQPANGARSGPGPDGSGDEVRES